MKPLRNVRAVVVAIAVTVTSGAHLLGGDDRATQSSTPQVSEAAIEGVRVAAEGGSSRAHNVLGLAYMTGVGVPKDEGQAIDWFRKAAAQGWTDAYYNLGLAYIWGRGVQQNYAQAMASFRSAADQGHASAHYELGLMYRDGEGVPVDAAEAVSWFRRAAAQRNAAAQCELGVMYSGGQGITEDFAEAASWYRKAADQGYARAQHNLAGAYREGEGVQKDVVQAVKLYRLAAEQGFARAQVGLGRMYLQGEGVQTDPAEAVSWFRKAAEQEDVEGQYALGWMYANGRGVPKDEAQTVAWWQKAATQGNAEAGEALARISKEPALLALAQSPSTEPHVTSVDLRYTSLLPENQWEEHKGWVYSDRLKTPDRPFAVTGCRAWFHRPSAAILQVCSDRNWLKGKALEEIEDEFLSPAPLLVGRSFLAENLMAIFFPQTKEILEEPIAFAKELRQGRPNKHDVRKHLIADDDGKTMFRFPISPNDARDVYTGALAPAQVILFDPIPAEGRLNVSFDVSYARHRFRSLGLMDDGRQRWLGFALVTMDSLPAEWLKKAKVPRELGSRPVRFLWLIGGTPNLSEADHLVHVVLAEYSDNASDLRLLNEVLAALRFGPATTGLPPFRQPVVSDAPDRPWLSNEESWRALFADPNRWQHPDKPVRTPGELAQLIERGKAQEALPQVREMATREPQNALHRRLLATALFQGGDLNGALEQALEWVRLEPGSIEGHSLSGLLLLNRPWKPSPISSARPNWMRTIPFFCSHLGAFTLW